MRYPKFLTTFVRVALTVLGFFATATYAAPQKLDWLLPYVGKPGSQLVWDPQFTALLQSTIPKQRHTLLGKKATLLSDAAKEMLGGPPSDVKQDATAVYFSACRAQSCDEKALFFADRSTATVAVALVHSFWKGASLSQPDLLVISSGANIPKNLAATLRLWLAAEKISPQTVRHLNSSAIKTIQLDSETTPVVPAQLQTAKFPAPCGSREYAFDPKRIQEQQIGLNHLLNPSGNESPSMLFLSAKEPGAQKQIHQKFMEISKSFSPELGPLIRYWSTFMEGTIALEEAKAAFASQAKISVLEAPVLGISPKEKCAKELAEIKRASPDKQKKLAQSSWFNCMNHAIHDKIGAMPPQADWENYLKAYGMSEKVSDQDECG